GREAPHWINPARIEHQHDNSNEAEATTQCRVGGRCRNGSRCLFLFSAQLLTSAPGVLSVISNNKPLVWAGSTLRDGSVWYVSKHCTGNDGRGGGFARRRAHCRWSG